MPRTSEAVTEALAQHECSRRGWHVIKTTWTERFPKPDGKWAVVRKDLFGFADGVVLLKDQTVALQWTDTHSEAIHMKKMSRNPLVRDAARAGWIVLLWLFDTRTGKLHRQRRFPLEWFPDGAGD